VKEELFGLRTFELTIWSLSRSVSGFLVLIELSNHGDIYDEIARER